MFYYLKNLIYPNKCVLCNKLLDSNHEFTCNICKKKLEYIVCDSQIKKVNNHCFDYLFSSYCYQDYIRKLLLDFKFNNKKYLCNFLSQRISKYAYNFSKTNNIDYIVYVPISFRRYMERGYNQSELIARMIEKEIKVPIIKFNLIKVKHNARQSELSVDMRKDNIKGVYNVRNKDLFKNKCLLLIDDIFTTGNTIEECSKVLKEAGASRIIAMTVARKRKAL